jgi:opacity protein-like surface antigen
MTMKNTIAALSLACALASPAAASTATDPSGFSFLLDGSYAYSRVPGVKTQGLRSIDSDEYTFKGALLYTFDNPGIGVQLEAQDDFDFGDPYKLSHIWHAGGSVFWRDDKGTIGLSGSYFAVDAPAPPLFPGKTSIENYGAFGEWYATHNLTLQIRGGGTTGGVGNASVYGGGGLTWYDSPDLAFHMEVNFTSFTASRNWTNVSSNVEYLPFRSVPMSWYAGYDFVNLSGLGYTKASTFFTGLKFHFGAGRALGDYHRTGPIEWDGNAAPGANLKF